jgi:hypothetical protein
MKQRIFPQAPGTLIASGQHQINLTAANHQPGDITELGVISSAGFLETAGHYQATGHLVVCEAFAACALLWMPCPSGSGNYYQKDGTASVSPTKNSIGTIVQRHNDWCELLLNIMPTND